MKNHKSTRFNSNDKNGKIIEEIKTRWPACEKKLSVKLLLIYRWRSDEKRVKYNIARAIVFNFMPWVWYFFRLFTALFLFRMLRSSTHHHGRAWFAFGARFDGFWIHMFTENYGYRSIRCIVKMQNVGDGGRLPPQPWRNIKIEKNKLFFIALERDMLVENAIRGSTFNVTLTSYEANEMQTIAKEILHAALSCFICSTF